MASGDSVGKINLDLEIGGDLSKQINEAAAKIGDEIKASLEKLGNLDFKALADKISSTIKKSIDNGMKSVQSSIEKALNKAVSGIKGIKIPIEFDMPKNVKMPRMNYKVSTAQPRAPPIPDINLEALKAQIDNLIQKLDITNAKIEQQKEKLAQLKESYNMAFNESRKNKLREEILKTEERINRLTATSDKTGFKIADLEAQFDMLSSAAKNAGAGIDVANNKIRETANASTRASGGMKKLGDSTKRSGESFRNSYGGAQMFLDSLVRWGIVFPAIISGLGAIGGYMGSALMTNTRFSNSLNQIRTNFIVAFMPIYQTVLPALEAFMDALARATAYMAAFVNALFGKTYEASFEAGKDLNASIASMKDMESQSNKTSQAIDEMGKSIKGVADFDEVHQLNQASAVNATTPIPMVAPSVDLSPTSAAMQKINDVISTIKDIMATVWEPFQQSWEVQGQNTINAAKFALKGIEDVVKSIGQSFATVWTNGTGTAVLSNILKIVQDILNFVGNIGEAFSKAWNTAGLGTSVIQAVFDAINGILNLVYQIGQSINEVASNGTAQTTFTILLTIFRNIFQTVKDIASTFSTAWTSGNIGTQIIQNLWNAFNNVLSIISGISDSLKRVWSQEGPTFAGIFMQSLNAVSGVIENLTQKLGWVWDHGGQHAFEGLVRLGLKVGELALFILTNFVTPFVNWFVNMISPAVAVVLDWIGKLFDKLSEVIAWLMGSGKPVLDAIIITVTTFFAAWEIAKILAFIQQAGGLISFIKNITTAILTCTAAKVADGLETVALTLMYAGEFISSLVKGTAQLVVQAAQFTINTALKIADTAAQIALTAATVAWNVVCVIATGVTTAFGAAVAFLTSPLGLVVVAIAAVIAIGVLLYKNWDTIKTEAVKLWNGVKNEFEKFKDWLGNIFATDWSKRFGAFGDVLNGFLANVKNIFGGVKEIFSGIIDFIAGVFTGNWSRAWKGVTEIFKGIFNTLSAIAKAPLNAVISIINAAISGINKINVKIPSWVPGLGGKSFGVNIPKIPYLAQGGIIDQPTLAMVGEKGKEAVVPLEDTSFVNTLAQAVAKAVSSSIKSDQGNSNGDSQLQPLYVGTLIADQRGLIELERRMQVIRLKENVRRGPINGVST